MFECGLNSARQREANNIHFHGMDPVEPQKSLQYVSLEILIIIVICFGLLLLIQSFPISVALFGTKSISTHNYVQRSNNIRITEQHRDHCNAPRLSHCTCEYCVQIVGSILIIRHLNISTIMVCHISLFYLMPFNSDELHIQFFHREILNFSTQ